MPGFSLVQILDLLRTSFFTMGCLPLCTLLVIYMTNSFVHGEDFNLVNPDGSFDFGYETPDSYHRSQANRNNVVRGDFGGRSPETGAIDSVQYTAGPRGFRPRGKNIARKYDFSQAGPRPIGSVDDPYFDPSEDPSYNFAFKTGVYNRQEAANRVGDVAGKYSYLDDIGERHNVDFIAGKNIGFHVKTPFPDSNPRDAGPLYFNGRGRPIPRGRTSIQRGLDGSYRFVSAGPDQRRTEISDSTGHVRGSYTYLDDKGVQHAVHYIAGPETGYRVLKNVKGPHLPTIFPFSRPDILPTDFYDYLSPSGADLFDTAASGHVKPSKGGTKPFQSNGNNKDQTKYNNGADISNFDDSDEKTSSFGSGGSSDADGFTNPTQTTGSSPGKPFGNRRPTPSYDDDGSDVFSDDIFGPAKPRPGGAILNPPKSFEPSLTDDGSYKPTGDDGSYKPNKGSKGVGSSDSSFSGDKSNSDTSILNYEGFGDRTEIDVGKPLYGSGTGNKHQRPSGGTIVKNVGDRFFSIPPGAAVRAHVQAIDLLDLEGRSISPSAQLIKESNEEQDVETSNIKEEFSTVPSVTSSNQTTAGKNSTTVKPFRL